MDTNKKEYRLEVDKETGVLYMQALPEEARIVESLKFFYSIKPDAYQFHVVNEGKPYFIHVKEQNSKSYFRYCEVYIGQVDKMVIPYLNDGLVYHIPDARFSVLVNKDFRFTEMLKLMYINVTVIDL